MAARSQGSCLWTRRRPFSSIKPQRALLLCRSIPTIIFLVVFRWVEGLGLLSHTSNYSPACRITTFCPSTSSRLMLYSPRKMTFLTMGQSPISHFASIPASAVMQVTARPLDKIDFSNLLPPDHSPPSDRKSTRLNSSHLGISYAVFCLK